MSHVTHMNESCHTYERVMSHIWTSHVTHMNESCHTFERVMSHIWMSHVTHMNTSRYALAHRVYESCHTCRMMRHDVFISVTWHLWVISCVNENESRHVLMNHIICWRNALWVMSHIWTYVWRNASCVDESRLRVVSCVNEYEWHHVASCDCNSSTHDVTHSH